jgi:hypothetical protein
MQRSDKSLIRPDCFLIGAPKCGTTSLAQYLTQHPRVFFSDPKEPEFFNVDFEDAMRHAITGDDYRSCFRGATPEHSCVGEGSVWYLHSTEAVPRILEFNPDAKFIVMIRNPVDMVYSLHSELLFTDDEDEADFHEAWRLQEERRERRHLPRGCRDPQVLQYGEVGKLGSHLERLYERVSKDRVHVIVFDDFKENPDRVFQSVLSFLDVPPMSLPSYEVVNSSKVVASKTIRRVLKDGARLKRALGWRSSLGVGHRLVVRNSKAQRRPKLDPAFRTELCDYFRDDVTRISKLMGRDLTSWTGT